MSGKSVKTSKVQLSFLLYLAEYFSSVSFGVVLEPSQFEVGRARTISAARDDVTRRHRMPQPAHYPPRPRQPAARGAQRAAPYHQSEAGRVERTAEEDGRRRIVAMIGGCFIRKAPPSGSWPSRPFLPRSEATTCSHPSSITPHSARRILFSQSLQKLYARSASLTRRSMSAAARALPCAFSGLYAASGSSDWTLARGCWRLPDS